MNETEKGTLKLLGFIAAPTILLGYMLLVLPFSFLDGWVLTYLWKWFFVPPFHLPELSIWNAAGIAICVRHLAVSRQKDDRKWYELLTSWTVGPLAVLLFAFLIHWRMNA